MSEEEVAELPGEDEGDDDEAEDDVVPDLPMTERTARTLDFNIGKISTASKEALSKQLSLRMDPSKFKERFSKSETQRESALNRTSLQLKSLLDNRQTIHRLQQLNIIKEGTGKLQAQQAALKQERTRDNLNSLLKNRQTKEDLVSKGILHAEENAEETKKRLGDAKKILNSFLMARPDQTDLARKNILKTPETKGGEEREEEKKNAKQVIGKFLTLKKLKPIVQLTDQLVPRQMTQLTGIKAVSCGWGHTAALDGNGHVWVFGEIADGRLGLGNLKENPEGPVVVPALKELGAATSLSCGDHHTGVVIGGKLYMWGMGSWGRLGTGTQDDALAPVNVVLPQGEVAVQVACGASHTLVLTQGGKVYGFGWNKNGRVGAGPEAESTILIPTRVIALPGSSEGKEETKCSVKSICCGQETSLAVTDAGDVFTWGSGAHGALGHGGVQDEYAPRKVAALTNIATAACGAHFAMAITRDGKLFSWGLNKDCQLGREGDTSVPTLIAGFEGVSGVGCGKKHTLATTSAGAVYSWGCGSNGILGNGSEDLERVPKLLNDLPPSRHVACSWTHSAVVTADGGLFTFGSKQNGKLGYLSDSPSDGTRESRAPSTNNLHLPPNKVLRKASV